MILFIYGPTQAGKTLLARRLACETGRSKTTTSV